MKKITQNTDVIIGVDFGSSETSAAFYDLKNGNEAVLDILPGIKVIQSAVAILEQDGKETICIGDVAIQNAPYSKDFQIGFRKRPSEMNLSERNRMVAFMHGVYLGILNLHPDIATRPHVIYIAGTSSDLFFEKEEKEYLKMAEDAGLPIAGIIKRYSAAIFGAMSRSDSKVNSKTNGFLLVDYGANTIDYVYLKLKGDLSKPIYGGCPLGASAIERTLLRYAMDNPTDSFMADFARLYGDDEDSYPYKLLLDRFRMAKESFYAQKCPLFSVSLDYGFLTSMEEKPIWGFGGICLPKEKINQILGCNNRDGYIGQVKEYVKYLRNNILVDNKVDCVYIIGGASRMDFVRQIFMEVFNLEAFQCVRDCYPSVSISQGMVQLLAYAHNVYEANPYYRTQELNILYEYARD